MLEGGSLDLAMHIEFLVDVTFLTIVCNISVSFIKHFCVLNFIKYKWKLNVRHGKNVKTPKH